MENTTTRQSKENIHQLYEYVNYSLNFIEAKNGALLALNSGLIIGILSFAKENGSCWIYLFVLPALVSIIPVLASFYPLQKWWKDKKKQAEVATHLFRCETIACLSADELKNSLSDENDACFDEQKIIYIQWTAKVTARKYCLFRKSLNCLWFFYVLVGILFCGMQVYEYFFRTC
jgi:hypothetical protein